MWMTVSNYSSETVTQPYYSDLMFLTVSRTIDNMNTKKLSPLYAIHQTSQAPFSYLRNQLRYIKVLHSFENDKEMTKPVLKIQQMHIHNCRLMKMLHHMLFW